MIELRRRYINFIYTRQRGDVRTHEGVSKIKTNKKKEKNKGP